MTYIKTKLKRSIDIDAIITLHYFEYMKNFEFKGESHDFWSFSMLTKEPLPSVLMTPGLLSKPEISSFTNQMNSMRSNPSEKTLRIW